MLAYYWSQFDIPVKDLENLPQFSEERVLETLQNGIVKKRSTQGGVDIVEVTASCRYPGGGPVGQSPRGGISMDQRRLPIQTLNDKAQHSKDEVIVISYQHWYSLCFLFALQELPLSCADKMITDKPEPSACAASEIAHFMQFGSPNVISPALARLAATIFLPSVLSAFMIHLSSSWPPAELRPRRPPLSVPFKMIFAGMI